MHLSIVSQLALAFSCQLLSPFATCWLNQFKGVKLVSPVASLMFHKHIDVLYCWLLVCNINPTYSFEINSILLFRILGTE